MSDVPIRAIKPDDLVVWPDGTTCFHSELAEMSHKSDDYEIVPESSDRWVDLINAGLE